jgi:hypothetical protein
MVCTSMREVCAWIEVGGESEVYVCVREGGRGGSYGGQSRVAPPADGASGKSEAHLSKKL